MSKNNKGKSHLGLIIILSLVFALLASGIYVKLAYESVLKPTEFAPAEVETGVGTGYFRHCYNELNDDEKKVYSVILENIYSMPEKIEIPALGTGNLNKIFSALSLDNPDLFCLGLKCSVFNEGYKTYFQPTYSMTKAEYETRLAQTKEKVNSIIGGANAFTSLYEKELYVHDYIINNCAYSDITQTPLGNTMYSCLVEGKASCEGYSRSFQYIMSALGVDNRLITGDSTEDGVNYTPHMWNYLILDGEGYFVDVTWNDPKADELILRHTYFNVNTDVILQGHKLEQSIPLTTAKKYNYFVYENNYFEIGAGAEFEAAIENSVYNALQRGYQCVEFRFADSSVFEKAYHSLLNEGIIYNVYRDAGILQELTDATVNFSKENNLNIICLYF